MRAILYKILTFVLAAFLYLHTILAGTAAIDPRYKAINTIDINNAAKSMQFSQLDMLIILDRAKHSNLQYAAIKACDLQARTSPRNELANLYAGLAYENAFIYALIHPTDNSSGLSSAQLESGAQHYLERAYALAPKNALVKAEYGFFLWQFGNQLPRGLTLLKNAYTISQDDVEITMLMGSVYSNPSTPSYNPKLASKCFLSVVRCDPHYALPHRRLASLDSYLHLDAEAAQEQATFIRLSQSH